MNLHYLRVFLAVAEHEHITRASEELIISQPAVTKTIQNLECEIRVRVDRAAWATYCADSRRSCVA